MPRQIARIGTFALERGAGQRDLERIAARLRACERRVRRLAVERRIDVAAAGEHEAVDAREDVFGRSPSASTSTGSPPARRTDSSVVGDAAVLGDELQSEAMVSQLYIRGGTAMPIRSSTRVSCWRK